MNVSDIFERDAKMLWGKREESIKVHKDDIRAAGNQVEKSFNNWLDRMLPNNVKVLSGHVIGKTVK